MAVKQIWTDLDGVKVGILKDWAHNPLTTAQRITLGGTLNSAHVGLQCFDTDLLLNFYWTGSIWSGATAPITGAMTYKGAYSNLTTAPSNAVDGDTFVITTAGSLTWAGITFNPSAVVQVGDMVVRRSATLYDVIQGNAVQSSESVSGIIEIATQSEVNTGTDDLRAITPLKLEQRFVNRATPRAFIQSSITLVANTAFTINFPVNASNLAAFSVSVKDSAGSEVGVDVDAVSVTGFTITSSIAASNLTAFVTYI
jgi:hypothetical protein